MTFECFSSLIVDGMSLSNDYRFQALIPLSNFRWGGNTFVIPNLGMIQRLSQPPDLSLWEDFLSVDELSDLAGISHWLLMKQEENDVLGSEEKCSIFLLALWLAIPTRTQIRFRFECEGTSRKAVRLLDRFQWIREQVQNKLETKHLEEATHHIQNLAVVYSARKRLYLSSVLTYQGCMTLHWRVAFICFAAAVEGILTYSTKPGITKRLATSYACLTESEKSERDSAYEVFPHSYSIRSDILHGRASYLDNPEENRKELSKFSDLLRKLWKTVLSDTAIMTVLEQSDDVRRDWFAERESGYQPPLMGL